MPKRLEPSRQQQAFLSLIDPEYAAVQRHPAGQSLQDRKTGTQKHRKQSDRTHRDDTGRIPGFQLRDAAPSRISDQYQQTAQQLQAVFEGVWDIETIQQVLAECKGSASAATDLLLDMTASTQPATTNEAHPSASSAEQAGLTPDSSYWSWLPEECKGLVLKHLSSHDLAKAARTCREFADHIRNVRAGLTYLNIAPGMSAAAVRGMVLAYTGAKTVSLSRCAGQLRHVVDFDNMFRAVSQGTHARARGQPLDKLDLKGCIALRDDDVLNLCSRFNSLRGVVLDRCGDITDISVCALSTYTAASPDMLADPGVISSEIFHSGGDTTLEHLKLADAMVHTGTAGAQKQSRPAQALNHLMSQAPPNHPPVPKAATGSRHSRAADSAAADTLGLRSISLSGCSKVTDKGVSALLKGSPAARSLANLDLSGCHKLAGVLAVPPKAALKQLTANNCQGLSTVTIQLPDSSPLQSMSIAGCRKLKSVYVSAPHLQELSVDSSPQLVALDLVCPSLITLSASRCGRLEELASQFECPQLQQLNMFGCRQLRTEDTEEVLQALLHLTKLNLNGCICLSRLELPRCDKLTWLDCSGCASLHHIHVASPLLSHLQAVSCNRLVDVSLQATSLSNLSLHNCAELRALTYPELETALAQPPAEGSRAKRSRRRRHIDIDGCLSLSDAVHQALS